MLVEHFEGNRIQTRNYFAGNILMHPGYKDLDSFKNYPLSNRVLEEVFFIGCHPSYNEKVFARLDDVLSKFKG
jgi:CDP-6-deoxy-D-xylo-4-hexulose-3-dehydrase